MSTKIKPFRLINSQELKELQHRFDSNLLLWNKEHALFAFNCHLSCTQNTEQLDNEFVTFTEQEQPVALLAQHDFSAIKHCLFGDVADCFNTTSNILLIELLNQVLELKWLQQKPDSPSLDEWFYPGSPSLRLTLTEGDQAMTLYLHPQWVLDILPRHPLINKSIDGLHDALERQLLHWHVDLHPVVLPLIDMLHLQVGDVIKTDHPISMPFLLKAEQQTLCQVDIGESEHYKSIQITSSL
jgi:hypothetical protein